MRPMPSTVIRRYVFDHSTGELWVEFVSGRRYVYSQVPESVVSALGSAFAKGVYFNTRIRDRFPHREVKHEERRGNAILKRSRNNRAHDPDEDKHGLQEPLDGAHLGGRHPLVRLRLCRNDAAKR